MTRNRNRFAANSLADLNNAREIQENRGRRTYYGSNREARRDNDSEVVQDIELSDRLQVYESLYLSSSGLTENIRGRRSEHPIISIDWANSLSDEIIMSGVNSKYIEKPKYIKAYNYRPEEFVFSKIESDTEENLLYLGTEIEVDCGGEDDEKAKIVNKMLDNCYTVHDGSLKNGFEIVTHPGTLNYHKSIDYKKVFKWLSSNGYKAHDTKTCGLHIHVNRDYLSKDKTKQDLCITKILFILEKYWSEVTKIARRSESPYSVKIKRDSDEDSLLDLLYKAKNNNGWSNAKYNALNLLHKETIEFRMFKGTIKYETYIATLEFIKNIVDICKKVSLEDIQSVTFEDIIHINETEYLLGYLKEREIK